MINAKNAKNVEVSGEAIADAVNVANELRSEYGIGLIDDLPRADRRSPQNCILAKAFNFSCEINGYTQNMNSDLIPEKLKSLIGHWYAVFYGNKEQAEKLAEILNQEIVTDDSFGSLIYYVILPENIAKIAIAFDEGALEDKYYLDSASEYI